MWHMQCVELFFNFGVLTLYVVIFTLANIPAYLLTTVTPHSLACFRKHTFADRYGSFSLTYTFTDGYGSLDIRQSYVSTHTQTHS